MKSKITGGVWSVRSDWAELPITSTQHGNAYLHSSRSIVSDNGQVIAQCECNAPHAETMGELNALTIEELDANAHLLSAAADMQAAIRATLTFRGDPKFMEHMLRAVLAKSEGRAEC